MLRLRSQSQQDRHGGRKAAVRACGSDTAEFGQSGHRLAAYDPEDREILLAAIQSSSGKTAVKPSTDLWAVDEQRLPADFGTPQQIRQPAQIGYFETFCSCQSTNFVGINKPDTPRGIARAHAKADVDIARW
jgi:hypothetical protein